MRFPQLSYWLLVAIAVVMVLGHICALPFHAHAGVITTHSEERDSHHGDADPNEDVIHAASCDAAKAPPAADGVTVLVPVGVVPLVISSTGLHLVEADASILVGSPPLFLLHAALLI